MKVDMKVKIRTNFVKCLRYGLAGMVGSVVLGVCSGALASALTYQDSVDVQFTFEPSLTVGLSSSALTIPSLSPGNAAHSNTISVNVATNNVYGYTLSAKVGGTGQTSETAALTNTNTNTTFASLGSSDSLILANLGSNTWGYTTAGTINDASTTYSGLQYGTDTTLNVTKNYTGTAFSDYPGTNNTSFTIAAKASTDQLAGEYTNVITFTSVVNNVDSIIYLQDITAATCPSTVTTVYDKRDESEYRVQKLNDGNCWMLDNLALDLTALTQAQLYGTGSDAGKMTNASNTTLGYLKNGGGSSPYTAYAVAAATSADYYDRPAIAKSGTCYDAYCVNGGTAGSPWSYTDSTSVTINGVTSRVQGKIGIYYNYCAASAGSYCYSSISSSGNATEDICPAGWHLPTGDTAKGSFYYLYNTGYSADYNNFVDALSTPLSGNFYSGTARYQGNGGYWWSSTRSGDDAMYRLLMNSSDVYPQYSNSRGYGNSVRCVATGS